MQPLAVVNTINDWATQDIPTLTANLRAAMKPGEIVLVHDGGGRPLRHAGRGPDRRHRAPRRGLDVHAPARHAAHRRRARSSSTPTSRTGSTAGCRATAGPGAPTLELSPVAHGGTQAALVTNRVNQGAGIGHDVTGLLEAGRRYELTAWLRFAEGQPIDEIWLSLQSTVGGSQSFSTLGPVREHHQHRLDRGDGPLHHAGRRQRVHLLRDAVRRRGHRQHEPDSSSTTSCSGCRSRAVIEDIPGIQTTVDFPLGVAIDSRETAGAPSELLLRHFNQVTAENHMKPEAWYDADAQLRAARPGHAIMEFAQENDLRVYGHVLVWHSQTPAWFFQDAAGEPLTNSAADQQILRDRLRTHIFAIAENLSDTYGAVRQRHQPAGRVGRRQRGGLRQRRLRRRSAPQQLVQRSSARSSSTSRSSTRTRRSTTTYAAAGRDHPVTLFINDYNTEQGGKQARYHALVERLLARGVPVDGVGHQFHVNLAMPVVGARRRRSSRSRTCR